jgi:hypothetical protein
MKIRFACLLLLSVLALPVLRAQSPAALDAKNGFRMVKFGEPFSQAFAVQFQSEDKRQVIATRNGDLLSLDGIALQPIRYTFFDGKLVWITMELQNMADRKAVTRLFTKLYGPPNDGFRSRAANYDIWRGTLVQLELGNVDEKATRINLYNMAAAKALKPWQEEQDAKGKPKEVPADVQEKLRLESIKDGM